jgi:hypothetical protein
MAAHVVPVRVMEQCVRGDIEIIEIIGGLP